MTTGQSFQLETRVRRADGVYRWFLLCQVPFRDEQGTIRKWFGTLSDIEDRKRTEQQQERLRRLEADLAHINRVSTLGELTASIAHEVNQPLSGVVSNGGACVRWLDGDVPDLEEARAAARRIVRDGKRAGEIIARIRALTRRKEVPREPLDLNESIREVLALVSDQLKKHDVILRTDLADDVFTVLGDQVQLQQVVLNLVMNAIDAMSHVRERARELVITTRNTDADEVQVLVEDWGIGLDPNSVPLDLRLVSIRPRRVAWAWDSRFAVPFFRPMEAGCGLRPKTVQVRSSVLLFPGTPTKRQLQGSRESNENANDGTGCCRSRR
jgi:C4-dicarboxylate-specific signal transduction histidine kinase